MMPLLTDKNFLLYAAQNYRNPASTGQEEFLEDVRRIKYVKKLVTRFMETGELKERLILNHLVVLGNVFNPVALSRILFLKMESQFGYVKPFLVMLGFMPEIIENVKEIRKVNTDVIVMNQTIIDALRALAPAKRIDVI